MHHQHHKRFEATSAPAPGGHTVSRRVGRAAFGGFPGPFGPPFGGHGRARGRGPGGRARRGDVRSAILALLSERPMHGYEIITELQERTNGIWKVSPGSVYPALQLLEDEGHIRAEEEGGKRRFSLTDSGMTLAAERTAAKTPWEEVLEGVDPGALELRGAVATLFGAVRQVAMVGSDAQKTEAVALLAETRRRLYAILAEDA